MEDDILADLACRYKWPKAIAVTGALGSGKTEFVLNLARGLKKTGNTVTIADADIINPYFCIRQITEFLEQEGFSIINPPDSAKWSDMSVINSHIGAALIDSAHHLIIDVGGDAGGVMALKQFEPDIRAAGYKLLLIVNAYRPKTSTPEGIADMVMRMEALGGLSVGALISNSHLMDKTLPIDVADGLDVVLEAGRGLNLPVLYATVLPELYRETDLLMKERKYEIPLWPMTRFMKRPWEGSEMWS
ncbi:MAG: zeta toxin family protein [Synergistaceae bacterium]|nr:zeta toxin family protein [Synergistaceae bacterium]